MLSVCVIARDEEERIAACLASVPAADERVVVVDARTRDATARRAEACGARVVVRAFDDFSGQRNAGLAACTGAWVLFLDADETLSPAASEALGGALADASVAAVSFPIRSTWLGRPLVGGRWGTDRKVRAVRRGQGFWVGRVHEKLRAEGPERALDEPITHDPYRTWLDHVDAIDRYSAMQAEGLRARGRRPLPGERGARAAFHFVDAVVRRGGWRDGLDGVAVAGLGAAAVWWKWTLARG